MFKYSPYVVRIRRLEKEYRVPLVATLLFLLLLILLAFLRYQDRSAMARIFAGTSRGGQDYTALVSHDKPDEIKTQSGGNSSEASGPGSDSITTSVSASSPRTGSTTPSTLPVSPTPAAPSPSPTPSPTPAPIPFSASLSYFRQDGSSLNCPLLNLNSGNCKKTYNFSASVKTVGGPGTVQYNWVSNTSSANESRSFTVGSGDVFTTLSKSITLACNKPTTLTLQITLTSPTTVQSNVISVDHVC